MEFTFLDFDLWVEGYSPEPAPPVPGTRDGGGYPGTLLQSQPGRQKEAGPWGVAEGSGRQCFSQQP